MQRTRHWALRCTHEASLWKHNLVVTLTYDEDHIDWKRALNKRHLQLFLKGLRNARASYERHDHCAPERFRFFASGEYGQHTGRPHYHLLLFNLWLRDLHKYGKTTTTSELLSLLWQHGTHLVDELTPQAIAYVAGYCVKKIHGRLSTAASYGAADPETGEWIPKQPPFNTMSRRPGVGYGWYLKYWGDLRRGHINQGGTPHSIPRYYLDKLYEEEPHWKEIHDLQRHDYLSALPPEEKTERRLIEKEYVAHHHHTLLKKPEAQ